MANGRPIVFASDFGLENECVGICHAVIAGVSPESRVIDLSHNIEALGVEAGARPGNALKDLRLSIGDMVWITGTDS